MILAGCSSGDDEAATSAATSVQKWFPRTATAAAPAVPAETPDAAPVEAVSGDDKQADVCNQVAEIRSSMAPFSDGEVSQQEAIEATVKMYQGAAVDAGGSAADVAEAVELAGNC